MIKRKSFLSSIVISMLFLGCKAHRPTSGLQNNNSLQSNLFTTLTGLGCDFAQQGSQQEIIACLATLRNTEPEKFLDIANQVKNNSSLFQFITKVEEGTKKVVRQSNSNNLATNLNKYFGDVREGKTSFDINGRNYDVGTIIKGIASTDASNILMYALTILEAKQRLDFAKASEVGTAGSFRKITDAEMIATAMRLLDMIAAEACSRGV